MEEDDNTKMKEQRLGRSNKEKEKKDIKGGSREEKKRGKMVERVE